MAHKSKPSNATLPFSLELGERVGSGQDNRVFRLVRSHEKPHLRPPSGFVLKVNHDNAADHRIRYADERKAAESGLLYKKNKYQILKYFLGDFVPNSSFVLATVTEGSKQRPGELTVQSEVPRISLNQLSEAQRNNPHLKEQMVELMQRLKAMYKILGEVNARTSNGVSLDGKLDLGGVSDYVRAEDIDHQFDEYDAQHIIDSNSSPNLLVDPETLQLYCIDFDQGQWHPGMDEAKAFVFEIAEREQVMRQFGGAAIGHTPDV